MIYERYLGGVLCHHGVKGQKWGVRRTPEQLGYITGSAVAKIVKTDTIADGVYRSSKGFTADGRKFSAYCLKPGADHAKEFFDLGYKPGDADRLFHDLEAGYDLSKKRDIVPVSKTREKFSIPISLGVTSQRLFRTVWQKDDPDGESRFITAYIDRRLEED